jgi:hypothetical protein
VVVTAALMLTAAARFAAAQGFDREVSFLTIPTGARVVGLGRAASALPGEIQSVRWNPATLGYVKELSPLLSHYDGPFDFTVDQIAIAVPAGGAGVLALSLDLQSFGEIPLFAPESPDVQTGEVTPNNMVVGLTLARTVTAGLAIGITGKWIRSELIDQLSGDTYGFDAGVLWHPDDRMPLNLGLGALNLGPGLRVGEDDGPGDPLPGRLRVGASYDVLRHLEPAGDLGLLVAFELEHALRDLATGSQYVGVELSVRNALFVRSGYIAETLIETNTGWTLGAGLAVGPIRFDLARELGVNQLGDETHVSLSARL